MSPAGRAYLSDQGCGPGFFGSARRAPVCDREPPAGCKDFGNLCRPSIGPSSIAIYESDEAPELSGRLLSTTLKHGSIYSFDPAARENGFTRYYLGANRLRDIEISDDVRTTYISTDSHGGVVDPEGGFASMSENPGAILVYTAK
jgi:hypothetical protein